MKVEFCCGEQTFADKTFCLHHFPDFLQGEFSFLGVVLSPFPLKFGNVGKCFCFLMPQKYRCSPRFSNFTAAFLCTPLRPAS